MLPASLLPAKRVFSKMEFDSSFYLAENPDVREWAEGAANRGEFESVAQAAASHFENYGRAEGRSGSDSNSSSSDWIPVPGGAVPPEHAAFVESGEFAGSDGMLWAYNVNGDRYELDAAGNIISITPVSVASPVPPPEMDENFVATSTNAPKKGDASHVYVGSDFRGDVWQLLDESTGTIKEWAVPPGSDSRNIISGTLADLGPPSSMTVGQNFNQTGAGGVVNVGQGAVTNPPANTTTTISVPGAASVIKTGDRGNDASHVYVGRDGRGDVYQLFDGTNVIEWAVLPGDDSRNRINSTVTNLGPPSSMTIAQATATALRPIPTGTVDVITNGSGGGGTGGGGGVGNTGGTSVVNLSQVPVGRASDPRHKYVGRDGRGDVWQIFDGTNVIEWAVRPGADSASVIDGTLKNIGPPGANTVAQATDLTRLNTPGGTSDASTEKLPGWVPLALTAIGILVNAVK